MNGSSSFGESKFSLVTKLGYKLVKAANLALPPYICAPATYTWVLRLKPRAASISTASSGVNGHKPSDLSTAGEGNLKKVKQFDPYVDIKQYFHASPPNYNERKKWVCQRRRLENYAYFSVFLSSVKAGKWICRYASNSCLSSSPPPNSHKEWATMSISNLKCRARYLEAFAARSLLAIMADTAREPTRKWSNAPGWAECRRNLSRSKAPVSCIFGTNLSAWKLHLHRSL